MSVDIYKVFLEFCAFEEQEIPLILPEWVEAANRLGLTEDDIKFAIEKWIPENWDIQYLGIRKMIGAYIREAIDITKAVEYKKQGVKIIYGILPAILTSYQAMKYSGGDKVFVSFPDLQLMTILNCFFHKINPYLECAEDNGFTYGCRHCALNKTRIAARWVNVIPSPDVIWSWGFNCDEGPKTDEYMQCLFDENWRYIISRIPHDTYAGEIDDEIEDRVEYLAQELRDGQEQIEKITGIKVTDEHIKKAIADTNRMAYKCGMLANLICNADPVPLGGSDFACLMQPMTVPFNTGFKYMEEAIDITTKEIRQAIKEGKGIIPKGSPKAGCFAIAHTLPWLDKLFRENGVALTLNLSFSITKKQLTPSRYKDLFMISAEQWLKMPVGQNMRSEVEGIVEKIHANKPDAMIMGLMDFDRWVGAHQKMVCKLVEEKTGVPFFYMEGDSWEDRDYSREALRTRVESICQIIKLRKMITD